MPRGAKAALEDLRALQGAATDAATKKRLKAVEGCILSLTRKLAMERQRGKVELRALKAELQDELISREATAARIAEKQRVAWTTPSEWVLPNALHARDRATTSTSLIEVAVRSLDFHSLKNIGETTTVVADVQARP